MYTLKRLLLILLPLALLGGCSAMPRHDAGLAADPVPIAQGKSRQAMHADLIRAMLARHQNYAALANIQELEHEGDTSPAVELLHAKADARLGHSAEAEKRYTALLGGPVDTDARHGLGRLLIHQNYDQSLTYLKQSVNERPTDPKLRNDYGYALMLGGCYVKALRQISTAQQLAPDNTTYRNNALLSLLVAGHKADFASRSQAWQLNSKAVSGLKQQAHAWPGKVTRFKAGGGTTNATCNNPTATASGTHAHPKTAKES